ncbi:MAG: penicillin-binding protein activator [Deltaproteobacteria bacterium]|nr:penicillin-binding protein activator [Deltaproteobacteria bacterium]
MIFRLSGYKMAITNLLAVIAIFLSGCGPGISVKEKVMIEEYPSDYERPEIQIRFAGDLFNKGEYERSKDEALKWLGKYPGHPLKTDALELIGDNFFAMGDGVQAFNWWLRTEREVRENIQKQEQLNEKLNTLIEISELEVLDRLAGYAIGTEYIPKIYQRIAVDFFEQEEFQKAKIAAISLIQSSSDPVWIEIGNRMLERIEQAMSTRRGVIGCLLPLSGPFAIYGQEVLHGILIGMGISDDFKFDPVKEIVIKDTEGEPEKALKGLAELVEKEKVMAVVGPLSSRAATAVSKSADTYGIPVIILAQKEGIVEQGEMVFRNFLTPSQEIRVLVDNAVNEMGIKRFAILYPDNSYGTFFMNLFWDQLEKMGGEVTAAESYTSNETDFADQIQKMTGLYFKRPHSVLKMLRERWTPEQEENEIYPEKPEPIVDFEAVFIPDDFQRVTMIAPQLAFHDVHNVHLLGTSLWQPSELSEMASKYVQGAIFSSGFPQLSEEYSVVNFIENYKASFDATPGILAAAGYDTIRILKEIMTERNSRTRKDIQQALFALKDFHGITGKTAFNSSGEVEKDVFLFTISGKKTRLLN